MELKPAYITIVEGPTPDFLEVVNRWSIGVLEGQSSSRVAMVEMRTFDGAKLVRRCDDAWQEGRDARLDFPLGNGTRGELEILATRWEATNDGDKLYLWVRLDDDMIIDDEEEDHPNSSDFWSFGSY